MADEKVQQGRKSNIEPFTVEFGDERNSGRFSLSTWREHVRGRFTLSVVRHKVRDEMNSMPDIPGQRMKVIPRDMKVELFDPLEKDAKLLAQINVVARNSRVVGEGGFTAKERVTKKLNQNELKSLLLELHYKFNQGQCQVVEGAMPSKAAIKQLDGREIYDVWNSNARKPRYKDAVEDWENRLEQKEG